MANRQNNNRRNNNAAALPIVSVPKGLSDQALLTSYQQQYAGRLAFAAPSGMFNVHADDALRRNVVEVLFNDVRRVKNLATRMSGQMYLVSPSTRQFANLGRVCHVIAPTLMAEDDDRERAIARAITAGSIMEVQAWLTAGSDPAATTVCRHTLQACDCHVTRGHVAPNAFFYAGVDVIPHLAPAEVYQVVARAGCAGFVTAQRIYGDDSVVVERDGASMIRTTVAGTGTFEEYDYRGFERGGLWLFAEPDGYVISGVCEVSPDRVGIVAYIQATTRSFGRVAGRLGHDEPIEKFETSGEAIAVHTRGGQDRTLIVNIDGRCRLVVRTTEEALRHARQVSMPSAKTSLINAVNTLKLTLKTAGIKVTDADVNALYVYGVVHASRGAIPAHAILNATLGYSLLPESVSAHLLAPNFDRELGDIIDRLTRLRATNAEYLASTGPTATAVMSTIAGLSCFAAIRRFRGAAFALGVISIVAGAHAQWKQFIGDCGVLVRRYASAAVGVLALAALGVASRPLSFFDAFVKAHGKQAAEAKLESDISRVVDMTIDGAVKYAPVVSARVRSFVDSCRGWFAARRAHYDDAVASADARSLSVFAGSSNAMLDICVAPFLEEYAKRRFSQPAAVGAIYGAIEGYMLDEGLAHVGARIAAHAALGAAPLELAVPAHIAINTAVHVRGDTSRRFEMLVYLATACVFYGAVWFGRQSSTRGEMATVDPVDKRLRINGMCLDECSRNDIRSGIPVVAVCHTRDIGAVAAPAIAGNVKSCRYTNPPPCDFRVGGWYVGGVRGYDICYDAQCTHNAYAGAVKRVMLQRPAMCRGQRVIDDERAIVAAFRGLLQSPPLMLDRADAIAVAREQHDGRDEYMASLRTAALRQEAALCLDTTAQYPDVHKVKTGMKYLVKIEKKLLSSPDMRKNGDEAKAARAIIPPQLTGKSLNAYNHAAEQSFFARTKARETWRLIKYEGTAEDAADIYAGAYARAEAALAAGHFAPGAELRCIRIDVKKCDASQGPAAGSFHRVQLQHLGVIDDSPPRRGTPVPDLTDECYNAMLNEYVANHTVDDLVRERTECQLNFIRLHIVYDEYFRFASDGNLPSGVAYTSGGTTRMVSGVQSAALTVSCAAVGLNGELVASLTDRCVRGDDNFVIIGLTDEQVAPFSDRMTQVFGLFGFATELEVAPLHAGRPLVPLCSHLMYPAAQNVVVNSDSPHLPAPRVGRVLTRLLTLRASVPRKHIRAAVYAAAVDLLHNCGHIRLLRILGHRLLATCGATKAFRTYDRDDMYRMTSVGNAELRYDDAECDSYVAHYYAHRSGLCAGQVGALYDHACMRMETWSFGEVFDGEFEQLAAKVDSA